jgi:O-antigen/teichoic acid export membrane protein
MILSLEMNEINVIKRILSSSVIKNSALAFLVKVVAAFSSYLLFVVVARYVSTSDFGIFSYLFSAAMLAALIGGFGQQMLIVKEIPASQVHKNKELEKGVYYFSFLTTIISAFFVSFILFFLLSYEHDNASKIIVICCAALCFLYSMSQSTIGALRIQNRTLMAIATRDLMWRVLVIVIFSATAAFVANNERVMLVFSAMSFVLLLIVALHLFFIKRGASHLENIKPVFRTKEWLSTSVGLTLVAIISGADLYLYTILISRIFENEVVGAFFAALKTAELINLFLMTVSLVVAPKLSRAVAEKNIKNLQLECNAAIFLLSIPTLLACLIMLFFAPVFMLVFDASYVQYDWLLRFLVLGMLVNALTGSTGLLFQLSGMHWLQTAFQGGSLTISLLLLPLFAHYFGINGAAISFILSKLAWNLLAVVFIYKKVGVNPTVLSLLGTREVPRSTVVTELKMKLLNK